MSGTFLVSSARNLVPATGERIFLSTAGIISWTVPAGVTSISIVVVGGGGGGGGASFNYATPLYSTAGGGGGGGLAYATDISVTPGEILEINVGFGGDGGSNFVTGAATGNIGTVATSGAAGGSSWVRRQGSGTFIVLATGGGGGVVAGGAGGLGGIRQIGDGGSTGGNGGSGRPPDQFQKSGAGGGGAAGYLGPGGNGGSSSTADIQEQGGVGTHGGGAGGNSTRIGAATGAGGDGGNVGIHGQRLDGVPQPIVGAVFPVAQAGPGSAIILTPATNTFVPTGLIAIAYSPQGISGLASSGTPTSGSNDDGFWTIALPWSINFLGTTYSQVFVGTNSYLTFGSGSTIFSSLSSSNPAVPKIMISSADNSGQRIYFGTVGTSPNRRYIIRFEGTASTSGTLGSPNMVVEYQFYESNINQIDFHIILNSRGAGGFSGIFNSNGSEAYTGFSITAGNAHRITSGSGVFIPAVISNEYVYVGGGTGTFGVGTPGPNLPASANQGRSGAVRIIWPGSTRRFPDENVAPRNV